MSSSGCISSNLTNNRYPPVHQLSLPSNTSSSTRSSPVTTTSHSNSPRFFSPIWPSNQDPVHGNKSFFPRASTPTQNEVISSEQHEIDQDYLQTFNIIQNNKENISTLNVNSNNPNQDLMDTTAADDLSVLDIFDPFRQPIKFSITPPESDQNTPQTPPIVTSPSPVPVPVPVPIPVSSPSFPYPIKLRLKLTACSEMKPFSQLVQQIRTENQSKSTSTNDIFYCKHVQRKTSQHIEQNQLPITLYIFTNTSKEPIRLTKISLQTKVAQILSQLLELIPFDYEQSILKLRSCEEYLCNDDALCDIEYVYNCINSLKQLQFVLVKKPISSLKQKQENLSFEQFYLNQQDKYFQTIQQAKPLQSIKSLNKNKQLISSVQTRSNSRLLEEFRLNINQTLEQIERDFNRLINPNLSLLSINDQIKFIHDLISYTKTIQTTCSDIQSSSLVDKQCELNRYTIQLIRKSQAVLSPQMHENLKRLLWDLLITMIKYIHTYCEAFLIPYEVEICNDENKSIDIERFQSPSTGIISRSITNSSELFNVYIESLFPLPSNIKAVRVVARLCYGNETKAKQMTRLMSFVRNNSQDSLSQVRFDQKLSFDNAHLCELHREALMLFEIYASISDDNDSGLISEVFDGIPMRRIGWCSQTLFDHKHCLITGERYLGIIDAGTANPTGFYSLRNVSDRDCLILTISFPNQSVLWPDVQARNDMHTKNFTDLPRDKQESLCRLLDRPSLLLVDHSIMTTTDNRKQQLLINISDEDREFSEDECHFLWSHRHYAIHKPHTLPKLLKSRSVWDYPSLIDIYGLLNVITRDRTIDEIESFELLLPAFPDMHIRSVAYKSLISLIKSHDLIIYLPQLLQIIKFDYNYSSPIIEHLLKECVNDHRLAHKLYWYLRQLLLTENIHFIRYYYIFMSLLYVIDDNFHTELQNEYDFCVNLRKIGLELKSNKLNRGYYLIEQLNEINNDFFQSGKHSCRLPCQFSFSTNHIDVNSCIIFNSLTLPVKLVFSPIDSSCEKYYSIYKIGDDLRQDQIVLQLLSCMDKIWKANDFDFRLSLFNVVQTQERCGFIEMITDSETLMEIERPLGAIKGSFSESALYDWLRLHNTIERDFRIAVDNLTYSCAGYCVATYILGIGDRHNENIMVKKSGQLFHIDFGKYLGDTQKFVWFNRDRAPFVFTKQMLYAMSDGGTSNDAKHRFIDLCCNAYYTLRQNSSLLLLLLSHLCSSGVPNLNHDAVRFVYDRLAPSLNYADSITYFTKLIVDSLDSTWTKWNGLIHKLAQTTSLNSSSDTNSTNSTLPSILNTYTILTDGKVKSAEVISYEKHTQPSKHYLYKLKVERLNITYHYRTYNEFNIFSQCLNKQFPLIGLDLKYSGQTEDKIIAQKRASDISDFLGNLFRLTDEVIESDLVCTFFHMTERDQKINEKPDEDELSPKSPPFDNQPKICIHLQYDNKKLFVIIRHANNLPLINNNEPKPYCKSYLFPDESKSTKRKGKIAYSRNPIFNDTFVYEMDLAEIQKRILRVSVWNHILNVGNHGLGDVDIVLSQIDLSTEKPVIIRSQLLIDEFLF